MIAKGFAGSVGGVGGGPRDMLYMGGQGSDGSDGQGGDLSSSGGVPGDGTPGGGGKNGTGGATYDPTATGKTFGDKLNKYLSDPAPVFGENLYTGMGDGGTGRGLNYMGETADWARSGGGFGRAFDYADSLQKNGGLTDGMQNDISKVEGLNSVYGDMAGTAGGPSYTEQQFGNERYGASAPGYDTVRKKLQNDVLTGVGSQFNAGSRFGGGSHVGAATTALTDALGGMDMDQYRYGEGLRRQDAGNIDAQRGAGFDRRLGALDRQAGTLGQAYGMRQGGVNNALTAGGSLGQRYQDMLMPGQTITGIGEKLDADTQGIKLGQFDQFNRTKNADYDRFRELLGDFSGTQGNAGMEEKVPWWQQLMGYVAGNVGNAMKYGGGG